MNEDTLYRLLRTVMAPLPGDTLWRLGGSANLLVQGISLSPKDLDMTTNAQGLETFRSTFSKECVKDYYKESLPAHVLEFCILGEEVEVIHRDDPNLDLLDHVVWASWKDLRVPVLPLQKARVFYERTGKEDRVALIDAYLNS